MRTYAVSLYELVKEENTTADEIEIETPTYTCATCLYFHPLKEGTGFCYDIKCIHYMHVLYREHPACEFYWLDAPNVHP